MALKYKCQICNTPIGYEGLCWKCRAAKEREEAMNLTEPQIQERQQYLIDNLQELGDQDEPALTYFWDCLSYHGVISQDVQRAAVAEKIFFPVEIYYKAPEDVRDELIKNLLDTDNSLEQYHIMCCLGMQGDDKALDTLYRIKKRTLNLKAELRAEPDVCVRGGGWTFDEDGQRRAINFDKCFSLEKKNTGDKVVMIGKTRTDTCPQCSAKLVDILSVDGTDERMKFLGIPGKITATCCPNCVCYSDFGYSRFQFDGRSEAIFPYKMYVDNTENYLSEEEYEHMENSGFELSEEERPLFFGGNDWDTMTLGGFPHWIQNCEIAKCPDCGKPMKYLGQLTWENILGDYFEGTLYVEVCSDCKVAAMTHQQT